jgi:hypothetical protein
MKLSWRCRIATCSRCPPDGQLERLPRSLPRPEELESPEEQLTDVDPGLAGDRRRDDALLQRRPTIRSFSSRDHRRRRCTDVITSTRALVARRARPSRGFPSHSIFDFFNSIGQKRPSDLVNAESAFFPNSGR